MGGGGQGGGVIGGRGGGGGAPHPTEGGRIVLHHLQTENNYC